MSHLQLISRFVSSSPKIRLSLLIRLSLACSSQFNCTYNGRQHPHGLHTLHTAAEDLTQARLLQQPPPPPRLNLLLRRRRRRRYRRAGASVTGCTVSRRGLSGRASVSGPRTGTPRRRRHVARRRRHAGTAVHSGRRRASGPGLCRSATAPPRAGTEAEKSGEHPRGPLGKRCSLFAARCSLFAVCYSPLDVHCSLFAVNIASLSCVLRVARLSRNVARLGVNPTSGVDKESLRE